MILYFADRKLNIKGQASTSLPKGLTIVDDNKSEDTETGVATFECSISFDAKTRAKAESCAAVGNYILGNNGENEFYTIIESEVDTKSQEIYIYAEDAGLDLLNEIVGAYAADKAYNIAHYINKFAYDSGFVIKTNEVSTLTRKLSWDGEATAAARIASVATQFDNSEISFSFDIKGLEIANKYINIFKKRGKDIGLQLRLNKEVDRIITTKTIANLATGLEVTGGIPDGAENPITLSGYKYDDGDFYVSGTRLYSRKALEKWSRYQYAKEPNKTGAGGHIVRPFSYDTTSKSELCTRAVSELKSRCDMEVNYEVDITNLKNAKIGDRINIIDDAGGLYLSTRILKLETSITNQSRVATLGEHLIKSSGISAKLAEMATQFAAVAQTSTRAYKLAEIASAAATEAQEQADTALGTANDALADAMDALETSNNAQQTADEATEKANIAQAAVDVVEESVEALEITVQNAQNAADNAYQAAQTAQSKAEEAKTAADNALVDAEEAKTAAGTAQSTADSAVEKANTAQGTASDAEELAAQAQQTAIDAKADAQTAQNNIDALGDDLTTLSQTMTADYARKTELTEATSNLQTQISQNADEIELHAQQFTVIDETANNAAEIAAQAQQTAAQAKTQADEATADATAAQTAANEAKTAAQNAQSEADTAKTAANTAKNVANKAAEDLAAAEADLATVQGRVDATEADILAAQTAVNEAQTAADNAQAEAEAAEQKAVTAQNKANAAAADAADAQTTADEAKDKATIAQAAAAQAQTDATAAATKANEAATAAATAQQTANTAKATATAAQDAADEAATVAANAQQAADDADAKVIQAQADLATAQQNLANVTGRVGATEQEVEEAKAAVVTAKAAADAAQADADAAQATANTAKANAQTAQTAANNAKTAADNAQAAADAAQQAADDAQADVDALAVRVTSAETSISQTAEQILLLATKEEVTETLGGYYNKTETEALIDVSAGSITQQVSATYTTKNDFNALKIGGRNLLLDSAIEQTIPGGTSWRKAQYDLSEHGTMPIGETYTLTVEFTPGAGLTSFQINNSNGLIFTTPYSIAVNGTERQKASITFKTTKAESNHIRLYALPNDGTQTGESTMHKAKLEQGNRATDHTPAPEDGEEATAAAQATADTANATATNNAERVTSAESTLQQLADMISMLVTDGEGASLMTQTANGWTFSMGAMLDMLDRNTIGLTDMSSNVNDMNSEIESLKQGVADLGQLANYVRITTDDEYPLLELGKGDSIIKLQLTNEVVQFLEGANLSGKVTKDGLEFDKGKFNDELQVTSISWGKRSNGNVHLMWKGDEA